VRKKIVRAFASLGGKKASVRELGKARFSVGYYQKVRGEGK